jgi:ABC-type multidrug transport system fused ATPase/permease subunit
MSQKALRIISFVFILLWGLSFFVGYNYAKAGDYFVSAIVTVIALIFMGGVFYFMLRLNDAPIEALGVKGSLTLKWVMIALYAAISLFMAVYINHMGIVSATDKTEIQDKVKKEIQELRTTFDFDEENPAPNSYYEWVNEQLDIYKDSLERTRTASLETDLAYMEDHLMVDSDFSRLSNDVNTTLNQIARAVDNWNIITVVHEIGILQNNKSQWEADVEKCSHSNTISDETFKCTSEHNYSDLLSGIINVSARPSWLAIILMLVIQFFILLSYFASRPTHQSVDGFKLTRAEKKGRISKGDIGVWDSSRDEDE